MTLFRGERSRVSLLLLVLLSFFFWDVVFSNSTFLTSVYTFLPGTMANGPYGYTGHNTDSQPTRDSGASAWQTEPLNRLAARMFKAGQIPLWNPYAGAGTLLAANMQSGALYPLNLLTFLVPDDAWVQAMDLLVLVQFFVAGYFTYFLLRRLGSGSAGALAATIAYLFSGSLLFYVETADARVYLVLPLLLYTAERLYHAQTTPALAWFAVAVALCITAGMPEATFFAILLATAYYAYRVLAHVIVAREPWQLAIARLARFVAGGLWGGALAAVLMIPFIEYVGQSWNSHLGGNGLAAYSVDKAISLFVPYFLGAVLQGWYFPRIWDTLPYVGVLPTTLALLAFNRRAGAERPAWLFGGFAAFYLLKAYGAPAIQWVGYLPLFNISILPRFAAAPFAFSIAVLAGLGVNNVQRGWIAWRWALAGLASVLIIVGGFTLFYWNRAVAAQQVAYIAPQVAAAVILIALTGSILALNRRALLAGRQAAFLITGLIAAELFVAMPRDRVDRYDPYTEPPFVTALKQDREPFRILGLDRILYPVTAGVYGVEDIRNLDALYPKRYTVFLGKFVEPAFEDRFTGEGTVFQSKFLNLLNVRYLVSRYPLFDRWAVRDLTAELGRICATSGDCTGYAPGTESASKTLQTAVVSGDPSTSAVAFPLSPRANMTLLRFEVGFEPNASPPPSGSNDVSFEILLDDGAKQQSVFSRSVSRPPGATSAIWQGAAVDLTSFKGRDLTLTFAAHCQPDCLSSERVAWKDIELLEPAGDYSRLDMSAFIPLETTMAQAQSRLVKIYQDEVRIYRNDAALPRAFIVYDLRIANGEQEALDLLADPEFDPSRQAVVETRGAALSNLPAIAATDDSPSAKIVSREPSRVEIHASLAQPGLLVLTDTYYPGWKVTVDGRTENLYPADYLFRSVLVAAGEHQIVFTYDPASYKLGFAITCLAGVVLVAALAREIAKRQSSR